MENQLLESNLVFRACSLFLSSPEIIEYEFLKHKELISTLLIFYDDGSPILSHHKISQVRLTTLPRLGVMVRMTGQLR
jgi:hypothetical protein